MSTTEIPDGGTFSGTILAGDEVLIDAGAASTNAVVYGVEDVASMREQVGTGTGSPPPGLATGTTVEAGGTLDVEGAVAQTTVLAGGSVLLDAGGQSTGAAIRGSETVVDLGHSVDDTVYGGGVLELGTGGLLTDPTISGGTLDLAHSDNGDPDIFGTIAFSGTGGVLAMKAGQYLTPAITGFGEGDVLTIAGLDSLSLQVSGNTVLFGGVQLDIEGASGDDLYAGFVDGNPALESGAAGGVQVVCFLAGTAIATPDGARAIETLAAGDLVLTSGGAARPVRWLGRQTVATRFADPARVAPVRIRAGALGNGLPLRDLRVSPDHALMVHGVFVQAGALVNGATITREDRGMPERFTYYHVELAEHALVLAEGVPAETFIDNVDRLAFDNWDEHAGGGPIAELPYPRAKAARQLPAFLRARLVA